MIRFGPKSETPEEKPAKGKAETIVKQTAPAAEEPAVKAVAKAKKPKRPADGTLL